MEQSVKLSDYYYMLRRQLWLIVLTIVVVSVGAAAVAYLLPPVYQASAKILVESQQIPDELARSTVTSGVSERLQLIEQRLMTRENLLAVSEKSKLYANRPDMTPTDVVDAMRAATKISPINLSTGARGPVTVSAFVITFQSNQAALAAQVTNEFVSSVLEQNLKSRSARASETLSFFKQETERLLAALSRTETEISDYKRENEGSLPDGLEFRRTELANLQERDYIREQRRVQLEENLRALVSLRDRGVTAAGLPGVPQTAQERDLAELERQLLQRRAVFADSHPEIKNLLQRIAALEAAIKAAGPAPQPGVTAVQAEVQSQQFELLRQIEALNTQLKLLADQEVASRARAKQLEESIAQTPQVELTLNALIRRRNELQSQYQNAVQKQADAETGEKLEVNQQAERFEVIEQAQVPQAPVAPNRVLIAVGGFFGSIAAALALAFAIEMLNTSIRTAGDLQRKLGLWPIVMIPYISTDQESFRRRWSRRVTVLLVLIIVPSALYAIDQFYYPLPLLVQTVLSKTGLDTVVQVILNRFGG